MNCETCQIELEDLLYGELSSRRVQEVRAHLAECSACRQHRLELEREQTMFAGYHEQTSREPGPELWASIRERIRDGAGPSGSRVEVTKDSETRLGLLAWLLQPLVVKQLAGALALVTLTVLATVYFLPGREGSPRQVAVNFTPSPSVSVPQIRPTPGQDVPRESVDPVPVMKSAPSSNAARNVEAVRASTRSLSDQELIQRQLQRTEREYVAAIRMLDKAIAKRKGSIDGDVFRQYEASLALIDDSIDKSRAAMRSRTGDPVAGQFLLAAYARKVELMQEIALQ